MKTSLLQMAAVAMTAGSLIALSPVQAADPAASPAVAAARPKVVFQVSDADPKKWHLALNNIKNVQADLGKDKVDVELVAYGPGIGMLTFDSETSGRIQDALKDGVRVVACENTMHAQKLTREDMTPSISYVSAGVVELMQRQQQGWAYIRP